MALASLLETDGLRETRVVMRCLLRALLCAALSIADATWGAETPVRPGEVPAVKVEDIRAIPARQLPPALAAFGRTLFSREIFDGTWYSPENGLGIRIAGGNGMVVVSNSPLYDAGFRLLYLEPHGATPASGRDEIQLPQFLGSMWPPDRRAMKKVEGRLLVDGSLFIAGESLSQMRFVRIRDPAQTANPPDGCNKGTFEGFWYSPELRFTMKVCGTRGYVGVYPTDPSVMRMRASGPHDPVLDIVREFGSGFEGVQLLPSGERQAVQGTLLSTGTIRVTPIHAGPSWSWVRVGPRGGQRADVKQVAIFVDGVDFTAILKDARGVSTDSVRSTNYLATTSQLRGVYANLGAEIETIIWNGDLLDGVGVNAAIDELFCRLRALPNVDVHLVTHSFGSVIAYQAIRLLDVHHETSRSRKCPAASTAGPTIRSFVTLASPIGREGHVPAVWGDYSAARIPPGDEILGREALHVFGPWINAYHSADQIGGEISARGVTNIRFRDQLPGADKDGDCPSLATHVDTGLRCLRAAHSFPYADAGAVREVWRKLESSLNPQKTIPTIKQ